MKRALFVIAALLLAFCGCKSTKDDGLKLVMDIDNCLSISISFQDIFSTLDIIVLDPKHPLPFGKYSEPQMWSISNDGFFFLTDKGQIMHYSLSGEFIAEYDEHGRGPGEFLMAYAMRLNERCDELTIIDPRGNLFEYSVSDSLLFLKKEVVPNVLSIHNAYPIGDDWLLYSPSEEDVFHLWDGEKLCDVKYSPNCNIKYSFNASEPFFYDRDTMYYYEGYSGNIFRLSADMRRMDRSFYWDFGPHTSSAGKVDFRKVDLFQYLKNDSYEKIFPFLNILKYNDVIYANVLYHNEEHSLFYDIKTNNSFFFKEFKEGYKFKADKVWNNSMYFVVESEYLKDYGADIPIEECTCVLKYNF